MYSQGDRVIIVGQPGAWLGAISNNDDFYLGRRGTIHGVTLNEKCERVRWCIAYSIALDVCATGASTLPCNCPARTNNEPTGGKATPLPPHPQATTTPSTSTNTSSTRWPATTPGRQTT